MAERFGALAAPPAPLEAVKLVAEGDPQVVDGLGRGALFHAHDSSRESPRKRALSCNAPAPARVYSLQRSAMKKSPLQTFKFMGGSKHQDDEGPYPGLFQNPHVMDPDFDTGDVRIRYEILVEGKLDKRGECRVESRLTALSEIRAMLHAGRYAPIGKFLAELRVYDADSGELIDSDRQLVVREKGQEPAIAWESGEARLARGTKAMVRAMGPPR